jgi:hypothetical protein
MKRVVFAKQSPAAGTKSACPSWASFDLEYAVDDVLGPESKIIDDLDTPVGRISNLSSQLQNGGGSIVFLLRNVKFYPMAQQENPPKERDPVRKVVQISTMVHPEKDWAFIALCDDSSLWLYHGSWLRIENVPQTADV